MKSEDFRIGNIVNHQEYKSIFQGIVTSISPTRIGIDNHTSIKINSDNLIPIPLTEELFLKFGGISYGGWIGIKKTIQVWDEQVEFTFELMDEILTIYANDTRILKINNPIVHSFQNLYFSLTGEELIIK